MFTGFATIMIVWFGVKSALTAGEVVGGFHFGKFAEFLLLIAFGYAMINYYNTPIPGFGQSFPQLVTNQSKYLTSLIGDTALQNAQRCHHHLQPSRSPRPAWPISPPATSMCWSKSSWPSGSSSPSP